VSITKAERVLRFRPRHSNIAALVRNYEWYVDHLPEIRRTSGLSHRAAWKQGAIGLGKRFF
jgi:hypothetical protein